MRKTMPAGFIVVAFLFPFVLSSCAMTKAETLSGFFYGAKQSAAPVLVDSDNDGIPDNYDNRDVYKMIPPYLDRCPTSTPIGVKVDNLGCPLDADSDGVPDYLDKCPGTPAGVKVDKDGCPLDSDGDGVPDYEDKCSGTPAGVKVDKDGCPIVEKQIMEKGRVTLKMEFDFDKAIIKKEYHDEIGNLADVMKKYPDLKIVIEGHTDNTGELAYNEKLSQSRADAVKQYLVEKFGIEVSRLSTKGYGEIRPIESNATEEGRQKNRRVEAAAEYIIKK